MPGKFGESGWRRALAPAHFQASAWLEAPAVVVLTILVTSLFRPDDPLLFQGGIRWTLVAALVVSLRYGSLAGALSMLTLVAAWLVCKGLGLYPNMAFPELVFLGGFIIILITGEFADIWRFRLQRAESQATYALERLRGLTQRLALLRLSHDRLEENLLMRPYTVRDALLRLRDLSMEESRTQALPGGDELLTLLAEYCQLQRGALYPVRDGRLENRPAAILGENLPLEEDDRLLRFALENGVLSHVQMQGAGDGYEGPYWVCAPVSNSGGEIIGVVTVERMPFLAMNHQTLQLFTVLLNFYADMVQYAPQVDDLCRRWPTMDPLFAREMVALSTLARGRKVETTLVLLSADGSQQARQILEGLYRARRNMDSHWWLGDDHRQLLAMLPMTGQAGLESFRMRIDAWLEEEYAFMGLGQAGVKSVNASLDGRPLETQLSELIGAADRA